MDTGTLARVLAEHRGTASQFCAGCDWTPEHIIDWRDEDDYLLRAHVAEVLASLVAASETQARGEAWDECAVEAYDLGWMHDYGRDDLRRRNPYAAALSSTDQQGGK